MTENRSWLQKMSNRIYGVPAVAQAWAKLKARRTGDATDVGGDIPFHPLSKPLSECSFSLITSGGVHLVVQPPFDMENPEGDASYREIPEPVEVSDLMITHKYYNHTDAEKDLNIIFPLEHFRNLSERGVIGALGPRHFGLMGHIEGLQLVDLTQKTAPEVARKLKEDGVDCVFLTPA